MSDLDRWFGGRWATSERVAIALARRAADAMNVADWRGSTISRKLDWKAFRGKGYVGDIPEISVQTRNPPLANFRLIFGDDHKAWPRNRCPVCAQPTYAGGDWREAAGKPRANKQWHAPCLVASNIWTKASGVAHLLATRQGGKCAITGEAIIDPRGDWIMEGVEVDHREPLWRVRAFGERHVWPDVLRFWGLANLQALSGAGHRIKTAQEARDRAAIAKAAGTAELSL